MGCLTTLYSAIPVVSNGNLFHILAVSQCIYGNTLYDINSRTARLRGCAIVLKFTGLSAALHRNPLYVFFPYRLVNPTRFDMFIQNPKLASLYEDWWQTVSVVTFDNWPRNWNDRALLSDRISIADFISGIFSFVPWWSNVHGVNRVGIYMSLIPWQQMETRTLSVTM